MKILGRGKSSRAQPRRDLAPSEMISTSAAAAEYLANKKGIPAEELVQRDLEAIQAEGMRPIGCLHVADLQDLADGMPLSEEMQAHVDECAECSMFLDLARPSPELEERFMMEVRAADGILRMVGNAAANP